ncbi:MAG: hypothetical protein GVY04_08835 [Cyanobacteria bacterium]|nr:hypothetical protein [Cyanobacteria bacterium GSL.Bin1]
MFKPYINFTKARSLLAPNRKARSRSFPLIQTNRNRAFLQRSRLCPLHCFVSHYSLTTTIALFSSAIAICLDNFCMTNTNLLNTCYR